MAAGLSPRFLAEKKQVKFTQTHAGGTKPFDPDEAIVRVRRQLDVHHQHKALLEKNQQRRGVLCPVRPRKPPAFLQRSSRNMTIENWQFKETV